jgi:acyl-CoA dehydrogenase
MAAGNGLNDSRRKSRDGLEGDRQAMNWSEWKLWQWPFLDARHHELAERARAWNAQAEGLSGESLPEHCRQIAKSLGEHGLLDAVVPREGEAFDVRSLCTMREALTFNDALCDAIFAMQGIGTLAIQQFGTPAQKERYLPACRRGESVAAFAVTEPEVGSDVASMRTNATRRGDRYVLNGNKTYISNAQFADHFLVVARTGEAAGARGLSAFIVERDTPGLSVGEPIDFIAEHPAAPMAFTDCEVPAEALVGEPGQGFKVAMGAFDIFRPSVGAAAVGLARRAMAEVMQRVSQRQLYGKPMAELQSIQMMLADMAVDLDSAALLVYRAAWEHDTRDAQSSYAPSMAKLHAAEAAGRIVDRAVQLFGGDGVTQGNLIEKLYREARPMRIYEGASEVQKIIVGRALLRGAL